MKRPIKSEYMTGHPHMDYDTNLAKYYEDLDKYIDFIKLLAINSITLIEQLNEDIKREKDTRMRGYANDYVICKKRNKKEIKEILNKLKEACQK